MAKIIDGKKHAATIRAEVAALPAEKKGKLAVVLVGDNPASIVYINMKKKACEECGIDFELFKLPENASHGEVLNLIDGINNDSKITGVLVQQPFPPQIIKDEVLSRMNPKKDVDCLHPYNVGLAATGQGTLLPCTPAGCVTLLKREGIEISGKKAVIVGRSDIVGKPLALMLLAENATVTICHSRTKNLAEECRAADILVAAIGRAKFITADMVKPGAIVIDVGVNRLEGKKVCGDVDYDAIFDKCSYITPVPGGVGPMTVATLMENCVKAWELQNA
ncbi:MAG: bifunctional 5,10-methylenetetrahydrofolate dehydrogenase/5,10-methenyltetrahydrofolate cyclohydrolase [Defluviitaleaceae bacterium]|nr:bifunctional 5,10-methylenetetrahydrofolate dehydrogenase/5,10-methenyltetrahydrofolate cyclohydrolase [Defluviitaleaceae bacterium]